MPLVAFLRLQKKNATPARASRTSGTATPAPMAAAFDFFFGCSSSAFAGGEVETLEVAGGDVVVAGVVGVDEEESTVEVRVKASDIMVIVEKLAPANEKVFVFFAQSQSSPQQKEFCVVVRLQLFTGAPLFSKSVIQC